MGYYPRSNTWGFSNKILVGCHHLCQEELNKLLGTNEMEMEFDILSTSGSVLVENSIGQ